MNKKFLMLCKNKTMKKGLWLLAFLILFLSFFRLPAAAEATVDEQNVSNGGDVPFETEPVQVEEVPEDISVFSELPERVNLSTSKYFPPIQNQREEHSCTAWATVYYQFTYEVARLEENDWDVKSDKTGSKVFSPKYVWNYLNQGENQGIGLEASYNFLKEQGSLRLEEFKRNPEDNVTFEWYRGADETETVNALRKALENRVCEYDNPAFASSKEVTPITWNKDSELMGMKQRLNEGKVLCVVTDCKVGAEKYTKVLSNGEKGIIAGETGSGHAITIVGYDDTISYDLNGSGTIEDFEKGAFLVANSWGTNTKNHNNGYIWIMYDALNKQSNAANLNTSDRRHFIRNNQYWYITVKNYTPQRMVEVTLTQKCRNDIEVTLANSNSLKGQKSECKTFLAGLGGEKSFDGGVNVEQSCTFVFDYASLYKKDGKVYWVKITDKDAENGANTTVEKIRWIDGDGNVLKMVTPQLELDGTDQYYYYGIPVKSITLNKTSSTLYKGESEQLTAAVSPSNATEQDIAWKSSNTSVVQVDGNGKVTYVGTGTAIVTATATDGSGVSASCTYQITDDYSDTTAKAFVVRLHTKTQGTINRSGDVDYFKFKPTVTGVYLIYTTGSVDTMGYLYDASGNLLIQNDDESLLGRNFALKCKLEAGKTYYIKVKGYSTNTGDYTLNISKDFYGSSIADSNQDARRVQMSAEAATILKTLKLTIGDKTYTLNRPASGALDTTINGVHFKVTFEENNNGLSTIWKIQAGIPATTSEGVMVSFDFSNGNIKNVESPDPVRLVAYDSAIKTGVDTSVQDSLRQLLAAMQQSGITLEVHNGNNTLVNVTSTTKAATGMKIIERGQNGWILKIHYLVVFGDITGGTANIGDGLVNSSDSLKVMRNEVQIAQMGALALLAADANHDGKVTSADALLIDRSEIELEEINQNYTITIVPDDCYYDTPVAF